MKNKNKLSKSLILNIYVFNKHLVGKFYILYNYPVEKFLKNKFYFSRKRILIFYSLNSIYLHKLFKLLIKVKKNKIINNKFFLISLFKEIHTNILKKLIKNGIIKF